jgi:hypothetical protein
MVYYDGSDWVVVEPGQAEYGASLTLCDGVPSWGGCLPKVATLPDVSTFGLKTTISLEVISEGGLALSALGIVYSTSPNPTLDDVVGGDFYLSGILGEYQDVFIFNINSETFATTYYVRAFATNSVGTAYGEEISFTSISEDPLEVTLPNNDVIWVYPLDATGNFAGSNISWGPRPQDIIGLPNYTDEVDVLGDYNGESNTMAIINELGSYNNNYYAAKVCADFVSGDGNDDWYLPAGGELYALLEQLGPLDNANLINNRPYWSSNEYDENQAWYLAFDANSGQVVNGQTFKNPFPCRCIRRD